MTHRGWLAVLTLAVISGGTVTPVWAQGTPNSAPITPPGPPPATPLGAPDAGAAGGWGAAMFVLAIFGLIVILGAFAKYRDMRNRREADALALQSRLSDVLLTEEPGEGKLALEDCRLARFGRDAFAHRLHERHKYVPRADGSIEGAIDALTMYPTCGVRPCGS